MPSDHIAEGSRSSDLLPTPSRDIVAMLIEAAPEALTGRIASWLGGTPQRDPDFVQAIYAALHRLAAQALAREHGAHTLQATALLHEAFLDLSQQHSGYRDRRHFFATASLCMRHILVDHARRRKADKRGDGLRMEWNDSVIDAVAPSLDVDLVALDLALTGLQKLDARRAQVVQLAYFGGFKREEIAELTEVSLRTVDRELRLGEAWLAQALA